MSSDVDSDLPLAIHELDSLSDRAAAVLGFALLDAALERLARRILVNPDDDLFGGSGILGTASGKMDALFQFGFLPTEIYEDLTLLRRIRNVFAHESESGLTFESEAVAQRISNLRFAKRWLEKWRPREAELPVTVGVLRTINYSAKNAFIVTVGQIVIQLDITEITRIVPASEW